MRVFGVDGYGRAIHEMDAPEPEAGDHDVVVAIRAAGVNHLDLRLARGEFKALFPYALPLVLGHDVAGVVEKVGSAVTRFAVGDEVFARPADLRIGGFAERIAIAEADVALKPASLSMVEAASMPLVALTAWQALVDRAGVGVGSTVLIHGGAGGFGSIAVQLAKYLGAHVTATASGSNVEWLRELGADEVVDYRVENFESVVSNYDLVIDSVGGETLLRSLRVLRPGGRVVGIAGPPDVDFARALGVNPGVRLAIRGLSARVRRQAKRQGVDYSFLWVRSNGEQLGTIAGLVEAGALRPVVGRVFPFAQVPAALEAIERRGPRGKVVIDMAG